MRTAWNVVWCTIIIGMLFACLSPFNFWPENRISFPDGTGAIHFSRQSISYSSSPLSSHHFVTREATLQLAFKTQSPLKKYYRNLLSMYNGRVERLSVGQYDADLVVRFNGSGQSDTMMTGLVRIHGVLEAERLHWVTLTSDDNGMRLYVGSRMAKFCGSCRLHEYLRGIMVLGNSVRGDRQWKGSLFRVAVYGHALETGEMAKTISSEPAERSFAPVGKSNILLYRFGKATSRIENSASAPIDLIVPAQFAPPQREVLAFPTAISKMSRSDIKDIVLNFVGFLPFGFFAAGFFAMRRKRASAPECIGKEEEAPRRSIVFRSAIWGAVLSFIVEMLQALLPSRYSQLGDLFVNFSGAFGGAVAFYYALKIKRFWKLFGRGVAPGPCNRSRPLKSPDNARDLGLT